MNRLYSNKISYRNLAKRLEAHARQLGKLEGEYAEFDRGLARRMHLTRDMLEQLAVDAQERTRRDPLPPGQARAMLFLQEYVQEHGRAPSRSEMSKGLSYRSNNAAECVLRQLARKGYLCLLPRVTGGIRLRRSYVPAV